ncbi:universal stress protein [Cellulomonas soli]
MVDHSRDARLVVLGRHGTGWVREAVIGSVAAAVVQHAFCPVVVVPDVEAPPRGSWPSASTGRRARTSRSTWPRSRHSRGVRACAS